MALVANAESIVARRDKGLRMEISGFTYQNISEILCNITQTLSFGSLENIFLRSKIVWSLYTFFIGWIDLNIMWTINSVINLTQRQQQQSSFRVSARTKTIQGSPLNEWKILFSRHWLCPRWMVWRALRCQQQTRPASHTVLSRPNE